MNFPTLYRFGPWIKAGTKILALFTSSAAATEALLCLEDENRLPDSRVLFRQNDLEQLVLLRSAAEPHRGLS